MTSVDRGLLRRITEPVIALVLLLVLSPLLALLALAIRLDSRGPILFRQTRTGKAGIRFEMLKFRTMHHTVDPSGQHAVTADSEAIRNFKAVDHPGISRVGRILRRTSLDELPQLWNVVRGEMQFIGPRPTSFGLETYDLWHTARLELAPGLTGLAQVRGLHTLSFEERCRLDIRYIQQRSLRLDLQIVGQTLAGAAMGRGA